MRPDSTPIRPARRPVGSTYGRARSEEPPDDNQFNGRYSRVLVAESGATAVEYALLVALIAAVVIGGVIFLGNVVAAAYDTVIGRF